MRISARPRVATVGAAAVLAATCLMVPLGWATGTAEAQEAAYSYGQPVSYPLTFPVGGGDVRFVDDEVLGFGACRDNCTRSHEGVDLLAPKMTPVYAAANGKVGWLGSVCCSVFLIHDDGWESWYIHLNNDSAGTDDGKGWGIAEGIVPGARVSAGQLIGWVGDSGNAEDTTPHLHFELHAPGGVKVDPFPALSAAYSPTCSRQRPDPLEAVLTPGSYLRRGSKGEAVRELQGFLKVEGYRVGPLDGLFGPMTDGAVRSFQKTRGLAADGWVGPLTRGAIATSAAEPGFASLVSLDGRILASGVEGIDVTELKWWLAAAGHDVSAATSDGRFDEVTDAAVRSFQEEQGLKVDGKVGPLTRFALVTSLAIVGPEVCR